MSVRPPLLVRSPGHRTDVPETNLGGAPRTPRCTSDGRAGALRPVITIRDLPTTTPAIDLLPAVRPRGHGTQEAPSGGPERASRRALGASGRLGLAVLGLAALGLVQHHLAD